MTALVEPAAPARVLRQPQRIVAYQRDNLAMKGLRDRGKYLFPVLFRLVPVQRGNTRQHGGVLGNRTQIHPRDHYVLAFARCKDGVGHGNETAPAGKAVERRQRGANNERIEAFMESMTNGFPTTVARLCYAAQAASFAEYPVTELRTLAFGFSTKAAKTDAPCSFTLAALPSPRIKPPHERAATRRFRMLRIVTRELFKKHPNYGFIKGRF